jgi:hypothetical protein
MKSITVSVDVEQPRERVFAFPDVMRNHERFTDHILTDRSYGARQRHMPARDDRAAAPASAARPGAAAR